VAFSTNFQLPISIMIDSPPYLQAHCLGRVQAKSIHHTSFYRHWGTVTWWPVGAWCLVLASHQRHGWVSVGVVMLPPSLITNETTCAPSVFLTTYRLGFVGVHQSLSRRDGWVVATDLGDHSICDHVLTEYPTKMDVMSLLLAILSPADGARCPDSPDNGQGSSLSCMNA